MALFLFCRNSKYLFLFFVLVLFNRFLQVVHAWCATSKPTSVEHRADNAQAEQIKQSVIPNLELFAPKKITQSAKVRLSCHFVVLILFLVELVKFVKLV